MNTKLTGRDAIIVAGRYAGRQARVTAAVRHAGRPYYVVRPYRLHGRPGALLAANPYTTARPRTRGEFRLI